MLSAYFVATRYIYIHTLVTRTLTYIKADNQSVNGTSHDKHAATPNSIVMA